MISHIGYKKLQNGWIAKLRIGDENNECRDNVKRKNALTALISMDDLSIFVTINVQDESL